MLKFLAMIRDLNHLNMWKVQLNGRNWIIPNNHPLKACFCLPINRITKRTIEPLCSN